MRLLLFVAAVLSYAVIVPTLLGQDGITGVIRGTVRDASTQEALPGANVVIVGTTIGAATNLEGEFEIARVPAGIYAVQASVLGYESVIRSDVMVSATKPQVIDFELAETTIELGEVTVTANYFKKLPDKPISVQVQSNEEIRRLPGGLEDVLRAVSILPGVAQVQAGRNDLIVRGGAPSENLFILDNIQIPNINHFGTQGASGGPLSYINLDFVSETQFSTGGFGARYGDRLSSVLTIRMRDGRDDRIGGKGTISATQFGLNLEGPIDENGSFVFSARRSYLDFIFKAAGFGFVPEYWDFFGKASYRLGTKDRLSVLAVAALDNVKLFNDTPEQRFDNSRILYSTQNQAAGGITWRHLIDHGFTTVTLSQNYVDYNYQQKDTLQQSIFKNISSEYETVLSGDIVYQLSPSTEISAGLQGKLIQFKADMFLPPFRTSFGEIVSADAVYDTVGAKAAAYAQVTQKLGRLKATLGGRVDYFNLISNDLAFSPRFSLTYALTAVTNVNASVGRYRQAPSYIWLVSFPSNRNLDFIGTDQIVLGFDHLLREDVKFSIEGFYKRYFDYPASELRRYLVLANTGAGFGGSDEGFASFGIDPLVSKGKGIARGVEVFLQKKSSEIPLYGLLSISYSKTEFTPLDGVAKAGTFDQRWIVNVGGGYRFSDQWEASAKFRLATGRPYTPYNADGSQDAARYNTERVVANHSLDLRVDRRWMFRNWNLIVYLDIQNVYNRKPVDAPRYNPQTGELETTGAIGILPSLGVSAEF